MATTKKKAAGGLSAAAIVAGMAVAYPLIEKSEGTPLYPYWDVVHVATECTGHTGPDVKVDGRKRTPEECRSKLAKDVKRTVGGMSKCITVDVPPHALGGFIDFTFNEGVGNFCGSTIVRKLNAGDLKGACRQLTTSDPKPGYPNGKPQWIYAKSRLNGEMKTLKALVDRRLLERIECEKDLQP